MYIKKIYFEKIYTYIYLQELEGLKTGSGASNSSPPAQNPADEEEVTKLKAENARYSFVDTNRDDNFFVGKGIQLYFNEL